MASLTYLNEFVVHGSHDAPRYRFWSTTMNEPFIVTGESADGARISYSCAHADGALAQAHTMSLQGLINICIVDSDDYGYEMEEFEMMTRSHRGSQHEGTTKIGNL